MGITIYPMKNRTFSVVQFFFLKSIIKLLQANLIITLNCVQKVEYIVECPLIRVSVLTGFIGSVHDKRLGSSYWKLLSSRYVLAKQTLLCTGKCDF